MTKIDLTGYTFANKEYPPLNLDKIKQLQTEILENAKMRLESEIMSVFSMMPFICEPSKTIPTWSFGLICPKHQETILSLSTTMIEDNTQDNWEYEFDMDWIQMLKDKYIDYAIKYRRKYEPEIASIINYLDYEEAILQSKIEKFGYYRDIENDWYNRLIKAYRIYAIHYRLKFEPTAIKNFQDICLNISVNGGALPPSIHN